MTSLGYSRVTPEGFIGFKEELSRGAWGALPTLSTETPADRAALLDANAQAAAKAWLSWVITALGDALSGSNGLLLRADEAWDVTQRQLHLAIAEQEISLDADLRKAAGALRVSIMEGGATAQTRLSYQDEVDFGRRQLEVVTRPNVQEDLRRTGLSPRVALIQSTTDALEAALKAHPQATRNASVRVALQRCSQQFNAVHRQLLLQRGALNDDARSRIDALLKPLDDLLARFPSTEG